MPIELTYNSFVSPILALALALPLSRSGSLLDLRVGRTVREVDANERWHHSLTSRALFTHTIVTIAALIAMRKRAVAD